MIDPKILSEPSMLREIVLKTIDRIAKEKIKTGLTRLREMAANVPRVPFEFSKNFLTDELSIIAEVKFSSPSKGVIAQGLAPIEVAKEYLDAGAKALSVLTEPLFFKGSISYLQEIRKKFPNARLLMKDFVVDEYQVYQARAYGADAILIIAALFDEHSLKEMVSKVQENGLESLIEVHDERELKLALETTTKLIGINNRNLKTMKIDLGTSEKLGPHVPADICLVSESGIANADQIRNLVRFGFRTFLIGTELMKTSSPGEALKKIIEDLKLIPKEMNK